MVESSENITMPLYKSMVRTNLEHCAGLVTSSQNGYCRTRGGLEREGENDQGHVKTLR